MAAVLFRTKLNIFLMSQYGVCLRVCADLKNFFRHARLEASKYKVTSLSKQLKTIMWVLTLYFHRLFGLTPPLSFI